MYTSFFNLKENPFNLTPDPRYLFLSHYHKDALDHLLYGINERKGFIAITGGVGTGKTTLCRAFISHLDPSVKTALIFNPFISVDELLKTINQEFGIKMKHDAESKKDYIDALNHFLLENFSKGENAVLLLDEAQNLSHTLLEQIRMLSNLETEKEKLIQIIIVGQPELGEHLAAPALKQLNERITVRYNLRSLDPKDVKNYIEHRLIIAGNQGNIKFTKSALKKISTYSQGNPRRINTVCDRALLIAYAKGDYIISKRTVVKAIKEVHGNIIEPRIKDLSAKKFIFIALPVFLMVMATAAWWFYKKDIHRMFLNDQQIIAAKNIYNQNKQITTTQKDSNLYLDGPSSLSELFKLADINRITDNNYSDEMQMHFDFVSLNIEPEYYVMLKKPFRVQLPETISSLITFPHYLLIYRLTDQGAIAIDFKGEKHAVTRDFILKNWGSKISWFYSYKNASVNLTKGMKSPEILEIQKVLQKTGCLIKLTGIFDELTFHEILKFQKEFGLKADGIIGPKTKALLYLMN